MAMSGEKGAGSGKGYLREKGTQYKSVFPDKSATFKGPSVNKGAVRSSVAKVTMPAGPRSA